MAKPRLSNSAGFTLVELLITMVLMAILSLTLPNFIANWLQASNIEQNRANLLTNAETALDTISNDIRLSGAADLNNRWSDSHAPNSPADNYSWKSDGDTLILARAASDSSQNILFSDPAKYISQKDNVIYYLTGTTLYRRVLKSDDVNDAAITTCPPASVTATCPADRVVATGVSAFSVGYYDADENTVAPTDARSVQLSITMQTKVGGKTISASYATRMVFRNE